MEGVKDRNYRALVRWRPDLERQTADEVRFGMQGSYYSSEQSTNTLVDADSAFGQLTSILAKYAVGRLAVRGRSSSVFLRRESDSNLCRQHQDAF